MTAFLWIVFDRRYYEKQIVCCAGPLPGGTEGCAMKTDLRTSLAAKCAALVLLALVSMGAAIGSFAVVLLSCAYGTADSFQEDLLCQEPLEGAMYTAVHYVTDEESAYYYRTRLERYGGFSAQIYDGEIADGVLVGAWSERPAEQLASRTLRVESTKAASGYYTAVGWLSSQIPTGTNFALRYGLYNQLHALPFGITVLLTLLLYAGAALLLVFLFCAAGHRAGREGIVLNWQDRIPLDLYLLCAAGLFSLALAISLERHGMPVALEAAMASTGVMAAGGIALATLLTMASRLKKGKWWRNTLCWRFYRWCRKLWRALWVATVELVRILPMAWRSVLCVAGILGVQSFLTLVMFESGSGGFFFLLTLFFDAALVVAAAWLTLQLQKIQDMGAALAAGDLDAKLDTEKLFFDVKRHGENLNAIGVGMNKAVEQRMKSERLKTELITNVSHDIKTPLTSIVSYVDLLKKEELPPAAGEYLAVLDRQANRLKKLTEDLVEASKASTGNIAVSLEPIVVNEIIHQAIGDYDEKLAAGRLEVIVNTYEGNLMALADGRLLWRVLDNLLSNVCKYAMAGTRVYVDLAAQDHQILLSIKNISRDPLNISADELMERFVRGDTSRHTEGSGLGLNIAKSLMDLMGGGFNLSVDGDLFKAELTLRA